MDRLERNEFILAMNSRTDSSLVTNANAIWLRDTSVFSPKQSFLQANADYFQASL